jgi:hypothetical protein
MRAALSLDTEGKPLIGVGDLPSWLTDKNAEALRGAPCIRAVEEDKACWYCKPTPKASGESNAALKAAAEKVHQGRLEGVTQVQQHGVRCQCLEFFCWHPEDFHHSEIVFLETFLFPSRSQEQAILDAVCGHPPLERPDAVGILFRVAAPLQDLKPDTAAVQSLETGQILEWDRKIPSSLGILRGEAAADKDRCFGRGSVHEE